METLGIIGGMGPMATAYLLELVIQMTNAKTDQEHLRTIVFDNPQVPDRTAYILDREKPSPLPVLEDMAQTLERIGCGVLCAPCVTSHYFYPELSSSVSVPFLHMVEETARELQEAGRKKAGHHRHSEYRVVSTGVGKIWHRVGRALPAGPGAGHVPDLRRHQGGAACQYGEVPAGQRRAV